MQKKIRLHVLGLTYSQGQSGAYALVLGETNGLRRIPIIIGQNEAQSIAIQLQGLEAPRPLTHDLIHQIMKEFKLELREVFIYKMEKEIFFSELFCWRESEEIKKIDARTSDAIALAVRANCPIYIDEEIFNTNSIIFDSETTEEPENQIIEEQKSLEKLSIEELEEELQKAIEVENYELASEIRDEMRKRKKI
jgi:bifunctional DNase/RNase